MQIRFQNQAKFHLAKLRDIVQMAIEEATVQKIQGSALTPFILKEITNYTNGRSLESNIALVKNNAKLAAKIAISWQKIETCFLTYNNSNY